MKTLILGGVRSGKSVMAEQLASAHTGPVVYVATAEHWPDDDQMSSRIKRHQQRRPDHWALCEAPIALGQAVETYRLQTPVPLLLVDCMSLWLTNLLLHPDTPRIEQEQTAFLSAIADYPGDMIIVSNEVGLGTIGMDALTRQFVDRLGTLNQSLAQCCDQVQLSVAGLALKLKG
ncbi:bifunctional adenosylcobinamide kinase/adenosylcobinamide-phosphate guanylyltransferase [Terasakiispira papahanaumokuakeensis]|uniref:Bifunctional adenosylcobalamin biosynthesis protein n=2 Tax=Terasakiispira papahanaumokuakeensis TaxID=197479 RepID=A0A1E2VCR6_9GAMM|nr:bifunctional adenosylcobinamide kinase/adenosylcobinamide-phosphate guanylyltransferase [Terasakiispira papahanaumokuakeensis]